MRRNLAPFILIGLMLTMPWAGVTETATQSPINEPRWTAAEAAERRSGLVRYAPRGLLAEAAAAAPEFCCWAGAGNR